MATTDRDMAKLIKSVEDLRRVLEKLVKVQENANKLQIELIRLVYKDTIEENDENIRPS